MSNCKRIEKIIFSLTNISRRKRGLKNFRYDNGLRTLSRIHSSKMARKGRIYHGNNVKVAHGHIESDFLDIFSFLVKLFLFPFIGWFGSSGISGENVALMPKGLVKGLGLVSTNHQIARAFHRTWMKSPDHRSNILNPSFSKLGIGVKRQGNKFYATELFYG